MGHSVIDHSASQDHGYAWIITLAVSGSNLLVMGYFRSFSVFFVEIVDTFSTTYTLASVIMGVQGAVCCVTTLVVHNILLQRFGIRRVSMLGSVVFSAGIILTFFAKSAPFVVFTLGVLVGVGNSAVYSPGTVLLGQYFEKRRALATSLACVGGSVGSMALPVLATKLIVHFGLKGAFLLFGGLNLHLCVTSALYRPPPPAQTLSNTSENCESSPLSDVASAADVQHAGEAAASTPDCYQSHEFETTSLRECPEMLERDVFQKPVSFRLPDFSSSSFDSLVNKRTPGQYFNDKGKEYSSSERITSKDGCNTKVNSNEWMLPVIQMEKSKELVSAQDLATSNGLQSNNMNKRHGPFSDLTFRTSSRTLSELDPSCRLSRVLKAVETASLFSSQPHLPEVSSLLPEVEQIVALGKSTNFGSDNFNDVTDDKPTPSLWQTLCACFSGSGLLLRNPQFWLIQVYSALGYVGSQAAFIYLSSLLRGKGLSREEVAVALTVFGACSLVGRLLCGVLADRQILRPTTLTALGFLVLGGLFFLVPVLPDGMRVWMVFIVLYGLVEGLYFCLMPVIIIDLLTLQHFSSAFGFSRIAQSTAVTLFFPLLGQLRDQTGNYNATFCFMGVCAILSASLCLLSSVCRGVRLRKTTKTKLLYN